MDFEEALDRFLKHLALSRTGSKDTDDAYRRDLMRFIEWLKDAKITSLEDVTKEDISQYVTDLRSGKIGGKPLSNASYARNLSSLRSFFRYLNQYEGIDNNPVAMFKSSNQRRQLPEVLTFDQTEQLLNSFVEQLADEKQCHEEYALYAMVERLAPEVIAQERRIYKGVCANVDFYSGLVYRMLELPNELFTPIFAISRIAGWSAHRLEELLGASKIIRPAYRAVQEWQTYKPISER